MSQGRLVGTGFKETLMLAVKAGGPLEGPELTPSSVREGTKDSEMERTVRSYSCFMSRSPGPQLLLNSG